MGKERKKEWLSDFLKKRTDTTRPLVHFKTEPNWNLTSRIQHWKQTAGITTRRKTVHTFWNSRSSPCTRMSLYGVTPNNYLSGPYIFWSPKQIHFVVPQEAPHPSDWADWQSPSHPTITPATWRAAGRGRTAALTAGTALCCKHSRWLQAVWQSCEICTPKPSYSSSTSTCVHTTSTVKWGTAPEHIRAVLNNCLLEGDKGISLLSSWTSRTVSKSMNS